MDTKEQINIKEQAEIYAYKHLPMGSFDFDLYKQMLKIITRTYEDGYNKGFSNGLAEGRKEGYSKGLDTFPNTRRENKKLKEENEELKKELMHLKGCKTCTDRPKGELATVCATEYESHCIAQKMTHIKELQEENEKLKKNCDFNCPVHKLATHNTCLTCPAVRNSPHHDLKDVSEEELQQIIKEAETEMEM